MKTFLLILLNLFLISITGGIWIVVLLIWALLVIIRKK